MDARDKLRDAGIEAGTIRSLEGALWRCSGARARLRAGLDEEDAADAVWVLNDPVHFHMLVHGRGWSEEKFQEWLTRALEAELL